VATTRTYEQVGSIVARRCRGIRGHQERRDGAKTTTETEKASPVHSGKSCQSDFN
jgi:hypothetical protein